MAEQTILIVDDSRMSRMLISAIAEDTYPDAEIIEAESGQEALNETADKTVQIATIDYNMPEMNGLELSRQLLERFPGIKIGLLTAALETEILNEVERLGIHFVSKPITDENLVAFLK